MEDLECTDSALANVCVQDLGHADPRGAICSTCCVFVPAERVVECGLRFRHVWAGPSRPGLISLARLARLKVGRPSTSPTDLPTVSYLVAANDTYRFDIMR